MAPPTDGHRLVLRLAVVRGRLNSALALTSQIRQAEAVAVLRLCFSRHQGRALEASHQASGSHGRRSPNVLFSSPLGLVPRQAAGPVFSVTRAFLQKPAKKWVRGVPSQKREGASINAFSPTPLICASPRPMAGLLAPVLTGRAGLVGAMPCCSLLPPQLNIPRHLTRPPCPPPAAHLLCLCLLSLFLSAPNLIVAVGSTIQPLIP